MRAPARARHFPYPHNFESRDWTSDERDGAELGEYDGPRGYCNGVFNGIWPQPVLLGKPECFSTGETYPPSPAVELVNGFDVRCYQRAVAPENPPFVPLEIDPQDRPTQLRFAEIQKALYDDPPEAEAMLAAYLGPTFTYSTVPNDATVFPGTLLAVGPRGTVAIVSGTSTFQQLAMQVCYAGGGPTEFGHYATNAVWFNAADLVMARLQALLPDVSKPAVFVGHSYGGAVASICAARWRFAGAQRTVKLLTYASPKPGDGRLAAILDSVEQCHLANTGDPVCSLPPTGFIVSLLGYFVPPAFVVRWNLMQQPRGRTILQANGRMYDSQESTLTLAAAWDLVEDFLADVTVPPIFPHTIEAYRARLALGP